ncbi:MAG TPA: hypothetical protein VI248_09960 [Kineosporiaceae bacterium]
MAVYRPIGLAAVGTSPLDAGRASACPDRRRAAADRLRLAENLTTRLDAAVHGPEQGAADGTPIDPDGAPRTGAEGLAVELASWLWSGEVSLG